MVTMMTKKVYVAFAKLLADAKHKVREVETGKHLGMRSLLLEDLTEEIAELFAADNPAFDFDRFYEAAGGPDAL